MQSQTIIDPSEKEITETKLLRMKELKKSISILDAEYKMLEEEVRTGYFAKPAIFKTSGGLILAVSDEYIKAQFQQTKFKEAHPRLFQEYTTEMIVKTFSLKK